MTDYITGGGIAVHRATAALPFAEGATALIDRLATRRGMLMTSGVEAPGRYARRSVGFADPPIAVTARGRAFDVAALNERGLVLLAPIEARLAAEPAVAHLRRSAHAVEGSVAAASGPFAEEARSRQPSVFSVLRALRALFAADDPCLGLYGAFGYDLAFQFEPTSLRLARDVGQRDLVLYLPDSVTVVDEARRTALRHDYEFGWGGGATAGLQRATALSCYDAQPPDGALPGSDHGPGAYVATVRRAQAAFARGDLFEVVPGQTFRAPCAEPPSDVFRRLCAQNPAPYGGLINLGEGEFLVSASPEMFVRVQGRRVETCPISGTIRRGADPIGDAENIRTLLNSAKDEAELTMCTDVDRNDKSRVCEPGSVRLLARRQIELYSRLIHTVDHVEGRLAAPYDALDAFLTHAWAVTVTGAPKAWAMRFIEQNERSPRRWYGGAFGCVGFDGGLDTGLTLRTVRMQAGLAEVRAGATLLHDSVAEDEDAECRLKASAMLAALRPVATRPADEGDAARPGNEAAAARPGNESAAARPGNEAAAPRPGRGLRVLLEDHEDSFVHTLGSYVRELGAEVETRRPAAARQSLAEDAPFDLLLLSPGPGRPADFDMDATLRLATRRGMPVFGVCLGLQGIVEHFGGALDRLEGPAHGRASEVRVLGGRLLTGLPPRFMVGRYHSLHARRAGLPACLEATAETADGVAMAVEHRRLPIAAVQFHPESIMTAPLLGRAILASALGMRAPALRPA